MKRHGRTNGSPQLDALGDWVRPMDAVRYLDISRSTLYELVRVGAIPSRRFGRTIRIPKSALAPTTLPAA